MDVPAQFHPNPLEGRYQSLFNASRDAVMTLEPPSWKFTSGNPAAVTLFRAKDEQEFLSYEPWRLSPPFQPDGKKSIDKAQEMIKQAMHKGSNLFEWTHRRINGEDFSAEVLLSKVEYGKKAFLHAVVRDITERKKAEQLLEDTLRLTASNTMFQQVIEAIPVRIFWKDKNLLYLGCNTLFAHDAGKIHPSELIGKSDYEMGWKNEADMYRNDDKAVLDSKKPKINYEETQTNPEGKQIWLRTSKIPLRDEEGEIIGILGTYEDITEHKKAEREVIDDKLKDEAIIDSIGDAVFACDTDGKILIFNNVAERLTGISEKEALGRSYHDIITFVRESDGQKGPDFIMEAMTGDKITKMMNHTILVSNDGRRIPVINSASPFKNSQGVIMGCVAVFHDVTHEREIDRAKTEFVSLASHQLRTPLSTINWYSELLLSDKSGGLLNQKQYQYAREIYDASRRMVILVNTLLDVSRLEMGTFTVEPESVRIGDVVDTSIEELKPQIAKKKLVLGKTYDPDTPSIQADPKLLSIIFQNLLSNAVKYTPDEGRIHITIEKEKGDILIKVADTGIGIPEDQKNKIFTKLFRADNVHKIDPDGTGLGLYIVKEILKAIGGKIWFESNTGEGLPAGRQGTTFFVMLPKSGMARKGGTRQLV